MDRTTGMLAVSLEQVVHPRERTCTCAAATASGSHVLMAQRHASSVRRHTAAYTDGFMVRFWREMSLVSTGAWVASSPTRLHRRRST